MMVVVVRCGFSSCVSWRVSTGNQSDYSREPDVISSGNSDNTTVSRVYSKQQQTM